eukprot:scaffold2668_cov319-Prasinococcus_capsulatus_cf.AAC.6
MAYPKPAKGGRRRQTGLAVGLGLCSVKACGRPNATSVGVCTPQGWLDAYRGRRNCCNPHWCWSPSRHYIWHIEYDTTEVARLVDPARQYRRDDSKGFRKQPSRNLCAGGTVRCRFNVLGALVAWPGLYAAARTPRAKVLLTFAGMAVEASLSTPGVRPQCIDSSRASIDATKRAGRRLQYASVRRCVTGMCAI